MTPKGGRKRYTPYQQIKLKWYSSPNPFAGVPADVRRQILFEAAQKARDEFAVGFPKLRDWFVDFDPLYVLSFCVLYFLSAPQGVDKEAVDGKIDFGPVHLELLQAFALIGPRTFSAIPLKERALELHTTLKSLTDALIFGNVKATADMPDSEVRKQVILAEMRVQTLAIRNWAFPEQAVRHLKDLFGGTLARRIAASHHGIDIVRLIDGVVRLQDRVNDRLNAHLERLGPAIRAKDFEAVCQGYHGGFPDVEVDPDGMRHIYETLCRKNLKAFKSLLMAHADLRLSDVFTFTLDAAVEAYGLPAHRDGVKAVMDEWSLTFGDLANANPHHFLYTNPVLARPFIRTQPNEYFWALAGIATHTLPGMLELLIAESDRPAYVDTRSKYLEQSVERLCKKYFPDGQVFSGSQWGDPADRATTYENDVLVILDTTAIVIEAKAHLVDPPARRGAEYRLVDTLEDQVVSASIQAGRFVDFLRSHPQVHEFQTRDHRVNSVDVSRILRFVPVSVTYENLGFISSNLKECVSAGLIDEHDLIPSIALTDFEVILETMDSQAQRIHYFARRAEIEKTMEYLGDESDLLALYLESGFNVGDWEDGGHLINLGMKSKELDPYFVARADGVSIPKPHLDLSNWWRDILKRVEDKKLPGWTELAYIFLNIGRRDQEKFEREVEKLGMRVVRGKAQQKHNWVAFRNNAAKRPYALVGYPYVDVSREERNGMMTHIAADVEEHGPVLGMAIVGIDVNVGTHPYDVLVYIPGHAPGAPDASRLRSVE